MVRRYRAGKPPHVLIFWKHGKVVKIVRKPDVTGCIVFNPYLGAVIDMTALWEKHRGTEEKGSNA